MIRLWGTFQSPSFTSNLELLNPSLTQEHNKVCLGARSYCHVTGVKEQGVGAAQCWQSICKEKRSVMYCQKESCSLERRH